MKAVKVIPKKKNSVKIVDIPIPLLKRNEVLVKVLYVGIDGTDRDIINGLYGKPSTNKKDLVLGHEALGIVEKVSTTVKNLKVGDFVVPMVRRPDNCINCQHDEQDMCLTGNYTERGITGQDGYMAEYFTEQEKYLIKIPKSIGKKAVLLEPISVAEKAIRTALHSKKRFLWKPTTALVTGSGTLGILCSLILRSKGFEVIIVDRSENIRKQKIFDITNIRHFNTKKINLHDIPKKTKRNIDIFVEATGNSSVALHGIMVAGVNSTSVLLSIAGGDSSIQLCSDCFNDGLVLHNKTIIGSVNANKIDFLSGIKSIKQIEKIWPGLLESLITKEYSLDNITKAIQYLKDNIKVIIKIPQT